VTEGHPDKMCDQVSDAILDAIIRDDPEPASPARRRPRRASSSSSARSRRHLRRLPAIVRETVRDIGYTKADYGFDYQTCGTLVSVKGQSPDIAQGVDAALEVRDGRGAASSWAPATRG
jgi:S-adenosylmethionine synthetase